MTTKQVQALENYFKTENEHWNGYAFELICEVLQKGNFDNPETPLKLFSKSIDIFTDHYETPLRAVQLFESEIDKQQLSCVQKHFVFEWVLKYVKYSTFEKAEIDEIKKLLKSHVKRLNLEATQQPEYNGPLIGSLRGSLKELIYRELEQLPETLRQLEPIQRLNVLCKLIPYVLPKVEAVHSEKGEPDTDCITTLSGYQW